MRVGVNLLWCVPGDVGGSEEYLVRQLLGLADAAPDLAAITTLFVLPAFPAAHPDLTSRYTMTVAPFDGASRRRRVLGDSGGATRRKERGQNENRRSGPRDHSGEPAPREGAPVRTHRTPSRRRASGVKSASVRCRWKLCGVLSL